MSASEVSISESIEPRLLDVDAAGHYLSVSGWTVRSWIAAGVLVPVRLPACHRPAEDNKRILLDRRDLDQLIESRRRA